MRDHSLYVVTYTARVPHGVWLSHDEKRIDGYSEPREFKERYVASNEAIAEAHWRYWQQYSDKQTEKTFVKIEQESSVHLILELH